MVNPRPTLGLLVVPPFALLLLLSGASAAEPKWEKVRDWEPTVSKELQQDIDKRIVELALALKANSTDPVLYGTSFIQRDDLSKKEEKQRTLFAHRNVLALALMQALPYLARRDPKLESDFTEVKKEAIRLVNEALEEVLPEYWENRKKPDTPVPSKWSAQELCDRAILASDQNYHVPILLMLLEFYFAGALEIELGAGVPPDLDRGAQPSFRPPRTAQLGIARLVSLLLSNTADEPVATPSFGSPLAPFSLWSYRYLGAAPELTCFSKSGTVAMGLRAAVNLGLLNFDDSAFAFKVAKGGGMLSEADFRQRLTEVLFHAVVSIATVERMTSDRTALGFVGGTAFGKSNHQPWAGPTPDAVEKRQIEIGRYRTLYATDNHGRLLSRIEVQDEDKPIDHRQVVVFRYLAGVNPNSVPNFEGYFGAYHTASGAYVLLTCSNVLAQLLDQEHRAGATPRDKATIQRSYDFKADPAVREWKVTYKHPKGGSRAFTIGLRDRSKYRYTPLRVAEGSVELPLDLRIDQAFNMVVTMLCTGQGGNGPERQRTLDVELADKARRWEVMLVFPAHWNTLRGFCCFGVMKACLAAGHTDHLGPWPWYRDLAGALCNNERYQLLAKAGEPMPQRFQQLNTYFNAEFALLTLSRSYRPLFPRSDKAPVKP